MLDGEASFGQVAFEAFSLLLATSIAGIVYGYLYFKTDNLWGPFLAHAINNGIFNVLFISTSKGMQVGFGFGLFTREEWARYMPADMEYRATCPKLAY